MGLDMFVYSVKKEDVVEMKDINPVFVEGLDKNQLFYWRKHHDLHGWMKNLFFKKGGTGEFNCDYVVLTFSFLFLMVSFLLFVLKRLDVLLNFILVVTFLWF